jgi:hypothetical protein
MRRTLECLGILLIVAVAALGVVPAAQAATVAGTVDTIDLAKKKITIKRADGTSLTLEVNAFTRITRNSVSTKLRRVALRDAITAKYFDTTAVKLKATGQAVTTTSGPVVGVNTGTGVLTIGSTSVFTNANTKISRNGKVVSLDKLTLHDTAVVHSSGDDDADDVVVNGPEEGEVKGTIKAITGQEVTITPKEGGADVTVTVDLTTIIEVGGKPAALADLQGGQTAEAEYDPTTFIAFSIEVDIPETEDEGELSGTVAAVDVTLGTLTITPTGGGADVVLTVKAATEVEVNDEHATLGDVQLGMPVKAEYDTTTLVATEVKAGTKDESD